MHIRRDFEQHRRMRHGKWMIARRGRVVLWWIVVTCMALLMVACRANESMSRLVQCPSDASHPNDAMVIVRLPNANRARTESECPGVLIAPLVILSSSDCLKRLDASSNLARLSVIQSVECFGKTVEKVRAMTVQGVKMGPYGAALVHIDRPIRKQRPALLASNTTMTEVVVRTLNGTSHSSPARIVSPGDCELAQVAWGGSQSVCIDWQPPCPTSAHNATTSRVNSNGSLVLAFDTPSQQQLLVGLTWLDPSTTCTNEPSAGAPTSSTLVVAMATLRTFVDTNSRGHTWTVSLQSGGNDLIGGSPPPPSTSSASSISSSSSSSSASSSSSSDGDPPFVEWPTWLYDHADMVYLSPTNEVPSDSTGTVGMVLTIRHILVHVVWFKGDWSTLQYAIAGYAPTPIPIKSMSFESDFYSGIEPNPGELVIVELVSPITSYYTSKSLLLPGPVANKTYRTTSLSMFDHVARDINSQVVESHGFHFIPFEECDRLFASSGRRTQAINDPDDDESHRFLCGTVVGGLDDPSSEPQTPRVPYHIGLMEQSGLAVVGAVIEAGRDPISGDSVFAISRFSAPRHRAFLNAVVKVEPDTDDATKLVWEEEDLFDQEDQSEREFPRYVVSLYTDDEATEMVCKGTLVSADFVLTLASCLAELDGGVPIRMASLMNAWGDMVFLAVDTQKQLLHPSFVEDGDLLHNVAVLRLQEPAPEMFPPIALNPGRFDLETNATYLRVSTFGTKSQSPPLQFASPDACQALLMPIDNGRHSTDGSTWPRVSTGLCMKVEVTQPSDGLGDRKYGWVGDPLVSKTQSSDVSIIGLAIAVPPPQLAGTTNTKAHVEFFVSFAENANFINANVRGHVWGVVPTGRTDTAPSLPRFVIGIRMTKDGQNFCGGALIAPSYVLTAAHCVTDGLANWVSVGSRDSAGLETEPILIVKKSIRLHPQYGRPHRFSYDVAIFELQAPAYAHPAVIDTTMDYTSRERATMYGYGVAHPDDTHLSPTVRIVDLPLLSKRDCSSLLPNIDESMLCAGGEAGKDACTGDSGGPLVLPKSKTVSDGYLVGIVSAGYGCGLAHIPGIYMRVASLRSFLEIHVVGMRWRSDGAPVIDTPAPANPSTPPTSGKPVRPDDLQEYTGQGSKTGSPSPPPQSEERTLRYVDLPLDTDPRIRKALLAYLIGDAYEHYLDPTSGLHDIVNPNNQLRFYSTGDLSGLLRLIQSRNKSPLYRRKARFGQYQEYEDRPRRCD